MMEWWSVDVSTGCPHTCIWGTLWGGTEPAMKREGHGLWARGQYSPCDRVLAQNFPEPKYLKFGPSFPGYYNLYFIKVGGQNVFYLTVGSLMCSFYIFRHHTWASIYSILGITVRSSPLATSPSRAQVQCIYNGTHLPRKPFFSLPIFA